jgi:hypothetical protein
MKDRKRLITSISRNELNIMLGGGPYNTKSNLEAQSDGSHQTGSQNSKWLGM